MGPRQNMPYALALPKSMQETADIPFKSVISCTYYEQGFTVDCHVVSLKL